MAIQWFYQRGGRPSGPVDSRKLRRLAEAGIVTPNTLVRKGASGRWVRAENVRGLFQRSTPAHSSAQTAAEPTPIDVPGPDSSAESNGTPGNDIRYVLAVVACGLEIFAYAVIGAQLGWRNAGGLIPMMILFAICGATWSAITKYGEQKDDDNDDTAPPLKRTLSVNKASALDNTPGKTLGKPFSTKNLLLAGIGVFLLAVAGVATRDLTRSFLRDGQSSPTGHESEDATSADNRHSFVIGSSTFTVQRPIGFVLLEDHTVKAQIVHPPDNQLHLVFVAQLDMARIMNGDTPDLDRYVAIQSNRILDQNVITSTMFEEVKSIIRSEGLAIPRNLQKVNEFLRAEGQSVEEALVIDFTETEDSYTTTALVKPAGGEARVNTVAMRNLNGCCIVVATTAVCRTQDDIEWSQSVAAECASSLN